MDFESKSLNSYRSSILEHGMVLQFNVSHIKGVTLAYFNGI